RCTDSGTQCRNGGNPSQWTQRVYIQTQEFSTGMVGTLIMGTAGVHDPELSTGMVGTSHNGRSRCADLGPQHRDGGNP
ncbi:unnamed protein product, partial [Staurois parvus]